MSDKTKVLMVDNYDSFTYNIVQYFGELGAEVIVHRNDEITLEQLDALFQAGAFDRLCISPGPCSPNEAGVSVPAIRHFAGKLPILGVCLGHQSIGAAFGGNIIRAQELMHGKTACSATCRASSPSTATTRCRSNVPACRKSSRSPPGPMMVKSWACATRRWMSKASSSIPKAS